MTLFDPEFDRPRIKHAGSGKWPASIQPKQSPLIVTLVLLWMFVAWHTGLFPLTLLALGLMLSGIVVIGLALIPAYLGYGLFALFDRLIGNSPRGVKLPEDHPFE